MKNLVILTSALAIAGFSTLHGTELTGEKGREILRAHQDSILAFSSAISVSASAGGRSMPAREQTVLGVGTVLTEDGLMVTALSALNPSSMLAGQKISTPTGRVELNVSAQIKELKIIMPDGLEIPANLVMKDTDLDLAFFRPKAGNEDAKDAKFHPINLAESGKAEVLDEVLIMSRLGKTFGYQPSSGVTEVTSRIDKPRLCYRVAGAGLGTPVYTVEGKLLGLGANRKPQTDDPSGDARGQGGDTLVVLPAEDVAKIAEQAKKAQPVDEEPVDKDAEKPVKKEDAPTQPKENK